jgi:o-succinylbenzoate synthase
VKVRGVSIVHLELPMRTPVGSAGLVHTNKEVLLVRLETDVGIGWGECVADPLARYPDAAVDSVEPVVFDAAIARLFAASPRGVLPAADTVSGICAGHRSVAGHRSIAWQVVGAALEMAVLDVELRTRGETLAAALGVSRQAVLSGALVGIPEDRDLAALTDAADRSLEGGARRLRLKIEPGWDRAPLGAVRAAFPTVVLQADANGSYRSSDAVELEMLDAFELTCLEQPLGAGDLAAHAQLAQRIATPIALDEALWSESRVAEATDAGACAVACLKPGRLGGLFAARRALQRCASRGVGSFIGGFFETGLGRTANATLGGLGEVTLPGDFGDPDDYLAANPFEYLACMAGEVTLSPIPGIGATVRPEVIDRHQRGVRWVPHEG